jgi:hypothetical protein
MLLIYFCMKIYESMEFSIQTNISINIYQVIEGHNKNSFLVKNRMQVA